MSMSANAVFLKIEPDGITESLREALAALSAGESNAVLDFSSIERLDAKHLVIMKEMAAVAESKGCKVALRDVNVRIYKVLKLARLTQGFLIVAAEAATGK